MTKSQKISKSHWSEIKSWRYKMPDPCQIDLTDELIPKIPLSGLYHFFEQDVRILEGCSWTFCIPAAEVSAKWKSSDSEVNSHGRAPPLAHREAELTAKRHSSEVNSHGHHPYHLASLPVGAYYLVLYMPEGCWSKPHRELRRGLVSRNLPKFPIGLFMCFC